MISQERVLELYDSANPVKDAKSVMADLEAASYLATLEQRSSEMTDLDTKEHRPVATKRWAMPWLVTAVAATLFGVALILITQEPTETPAAPSPTPEPAPATTLDPAETAWQEIPIWIGGIGTFRSNNFEVPFSFTVEERWDYVDENSGSVGLRVPDNPGGGRTVLAFLSIELGVGSGSVEETVEAFATAHELVGGEMTEPVPSNVGGASGVVFETRGLPYEVAPPYEESDFPYLAEGGKFVVGANRAIVHVVEVNGTATAIIYFAFDEWFDEHRDAAQSVIDSIVWKDLL